MGLRETTEPLGPPWAAPMQGTLDTYVVESEALAGNPLGDPARRPLYVYRAPGILTASETDAPAIYDVPAVFVLQAYGGQLDKWLARQSFEPTFIERLDAMFASADTPPAVVVLVDNWTRYGGAQWINSGGTGRYQDYLADEVVAFVDERYPTAKSPSKRGVTGHSSGGYGALRACMDRPDVFAGGLVAHAPDSLFEVCYQPDFPDAARLLRERYDSDVRKLLAAFAAREKFDHDEYGMVLELLGCQAAYAPELRLPFELGSGQTIEEIWRAWLAHDPVRMVSSHGEALKRLRHIRLEAGRHDEANLDLGAQALSAELVAAGVNHQFELFDGGHSGIAYRFAPAIGELIRALASN